MGNGGLDWIANYIRGIADDVLRDLFKTTVRGGPAVVEYEPDADLRHSEQIPLLEEGGRAIRGHPMHSVR